MNPPVLSVKNLTTGLTIGEKIFDVVENVTFDLHLGKTLALVGESGCGKSLTALSILRVLPTPPCLPPKGEVIYKGENLLKLPEYKMRAIRGNDIAMIFQDPGSALNPVYTIGNQLLEVVELHLGLYGEEAIARVIQSLTEVGIPSPEERIDSYPHQLSGGMKQRVMIAMALLCEPDILIADEPTTALDVTIQKQVLDLMRQLQKEKGMALLLITHDMGVVAEMADEVIVMYTSQAIEHGEVHQIFDEMGHPYTEGLFGSRPDPSKLHVKLHPISGLVPPLSSYPSGCRFHPRCPYVMDKCRQGEVPAFEIQSTHNAKCWLHDGSEESEQKRKRQ